MNFTEDQLADWLKYEEVRQSGTWNMYAPQARAATGLSKEEYLFVMHNYSELKEAVEKEGK
jgi:hypothetical protein